MEISFTDYSCRHLTVHRMVSLGREACTLPICGSVMQSGTEPMEALPPSSLAVMCHMMQSPVETLQDFLSQCQTSLYSLGLARLFTALLLPISLSDHFDLHWECSSHVYITCNVQYIVLNAILYMLCRILPTVVHCTCILSCMYIYI